MANDKRRMTEQTPTNQGVDSRYALFRLGISLLLMTIGSSAMYAVAVVLPTIQREFGVTRSDASIPYTAMMIGFGLGGLLMGRLSDRFGMTVPLAISGLALGSGYVLAGLSDGILGFALAHALLLGLLGSSAMFAPLVADTSMWFVRRRGMAVAVCASGNYLAGTIWPPILQHFIETAGWRPTFIVTGLFCGISILLLSPLMRERAPMQHVAFTKTGQSLASDRPFGLSPNHATLLLCVAGVACCVAMSMPQVHIVAYCTDLGYGAARGAEMLSLMLGFGIASRLISGYICDRIGGLRTLLLGSVLQGLALLLFIPFDGLISLYIVAAMFGLFQGGIVPAYAIIIREHFAPAETGARVGAVIMCTLLGMALGGWMSGKVFDLTGSYDAAFLNGVAWNLLNLGIALTLLWRVRRTARG